MPNSAGPTHLDFNSCIFTFFSARGVRRVQWIVVLLCV